jgi:hypothetical protein
MGTAPTSLFSVHLREMTIVLLDEFYGDKLLATFQGRPLQYSWCRCGIHPALSQGCVVLGGEFCSGRIFKEEEGE